MPYNRRHFIKQLGALYGSVLFFSSCGSVLNPYRVFTMDEAACLTALCEQLIPADQDPGATDAGVVNYIDRQTALRFPEELTIYQEGIASLQTTCRSVHHKLFEELPPEEQTGLMRSMERSPFFELLLRRTMQGFYGSPRHGGNRDYLSYKMMKLDYPLLIGQNRYNHEK